MYALKSLKLNEYYQVYQSNVKADNKIYSDKVEELNNKLVELRPEIENRFDIYLTKFNLDVAKSKEWMEELCGDRKTGLFYIVKKLFNDTDHNDENRKDIIILMNFCATIREKSETLELLNLTRLRKNITFKQFRNIVQRYYFKVHEMVLNGDAYEYKNGIGQLIVETWKNQDAKEILDYKETYINKQRLIKEGKIPYDKDDAKKYKELGLPYMGVKYEVLKTEFSYNKVRIINSKIIRMVDSIFTPANTMPKIYRPFSYETLSKQVSSVKDVANLKIGLHLKVALLDYMYPNYHIKFLRNAEGNRYKHTKNNSKVGQ